MLMRFLRSLFLFLLLVGFVAACNDQNSRDTGPATSSSTESEVDSTFWLGQITNRMLDSLRMKEYTGDSDADYIQIMLIRQRAAVSMYNYVLGKPANSELKAIISKNAQRLLDEIAFLEEKKEQTSRGESSDFATRSISLLDSLTRNGLAMHGAFIDLDFSTMIKQHHENAIALSELYLVHGRDEDLLSFAKKHISLSRTENEKLKAWGEKTFPDAR